VSGPPTRRSPLLAAAAALLAVALALPLLAVLLVAADPLAPADAAVALAGDLGERAQAAAALVRQGYAPRLIISDMQAGPDGQLFSPAHRELARAAGVPEDRLYPADRVARSTYTELGAIRDLARRQGWRTLIVVTSPQHTRRTRIIADAVFRGSGVRVIVRPSAPSGPLLAWPRSRREAELTLLEYPKLLVFLLGYRG
jgi:uncharacterized SAM-binding protein YcdF (DUF218 family)